MLFSFSGPMLAAHQRCPDKTPTYHDCCTTNPHSTSRLKEEPYIHYEVCPHTYPHATKDSKPLSHNIRHNAGGAGGLQGDQALTCPLLSGLVLGKGEQSGSLHGISQPLRVQMVLDQRRKLHMMEASYSHGTAGHTQTVDGQQYEAVTELQPRSAEDDRKMLVGMGVGVEFPGQAPFMSLNFHQILGKHGSMKTPPFNTLSHISGSHNDHGKDTASYSCNSQSPISSLSPDTQRETPHYIGTSVIITNER